MVSPRVWDWLWKEGEPSELSGVAGRARFLPGSTDQRARKTNLVI